MIAFVSFGALDLTVFRFSQSPVEPSSLIIDSVIVILGDTTGSARINAFGQKVASGLTPVTPVGIASLLWKPHQGSVLKVQQKRS
jgi:hypothetical protein